MIAFQLLAAVIGLTIQSLHAQEPIPSPTPSRSSVQFINATSVQFINLEIKDFHLYTKLKPGAKISGGHFDFTTWKLKATSEMDESAFVEKSLLKTPNTSSTVVLVGNFQWLLDENGKKLKLKHAITWQGSFSVLYWLSGLNSVVVSRVGYAICSTLGFAYRIQIHTLVFLLSSRTFKSAVK